MSSTSKQIILIALSVLLVVLFLFMPEKPASVKDLPPKQELPAEKNTSSPEVDMATRIAEAIEKVKGAAPMMGILELRSIAEEDPSQIDAQYFLGISSIQIGELEKAVNRFEKVITFAGLKKYPDTRLKLADCYNGLGFKDKAIEQLELETNDENSTLKAQALEQLDRLRN